MLRDVRIQENKEWIQESIQLSPKQRLEKVGKLFNCNSLTNVMREEELIKKNYKYNTIQPYASKISIRKINIQ